METGVQQQAGEKLIRILAFTLVISVMSATMFNIVLPEIRSEFQLSFAQLSWVTSAFLLIYAIGTVIYGKLADIYKLKNLLTFGLIFFVFGSLIGLVAQVHWRWLFCMPLFTLFTLPYYRKYLDDEHGDAVNIDWIGGGLLAGTAALLLLAITYEAWMPAAGCLILFILFIARIRSVAKPFIRPELFRNKSYSLVLAIAFLTTGIGYSLSFLSPQLLSQVNHLAPGLIGFAMAPAAITTAILGRKAGKLADAKGNPFLYYAASLLLLTCFVLLSSFAGISPVYIAIFLIFGNVGQLFMMIALSNTISRTLPKEQTGVGMGLLAMLNFIAGAVSASIYSTTIDQGASSVWNAANSFPVAFVYSNIYFVLAFLQAMILLIYYFQFGRADRRRKTTRR